MQTPSNVRKHRLKLASSTSKGSGVQIFRGRIWFAAYLWILAAACLALTVTSLFLDWFAFLVVGLVALVSAYACLTIGWGEAIARIELRDDGFSLRLPGYRGYFPFWPARYLEGKWPDVTGLARRRVHAGILGIRFDYIAHRVTTGNGSIVLFEPLPNDFSRNTRSAGLNLPVHEIAAVFSSRTGCPLRDEGEIQGGGLWRNLAYGGPDLS